MSIEPTWIILDLRGNSGEFLRWRFRFDWEHCGWCAAILRQDVGIFEGLRCQPKMESGCGLLILIDLFGCVDFFGIHHDGKVWKWQNSRKLSTMKNDVKHSAGCIPWSHWTRCNQQSQDGKSHTLQAATVQHCGLCTFKLWTVNRKRDFPGGYCNYSSGQATNKNPTSLTVPVLQQTVAKLGRMRCVCDASTWWDTCQNMSKYVKICQNMSKYVKICQNMSKYVKICQNMSKYVKICQNMSKYVKICQNMSKYVKICQNTIKHLETCLEKLENALSRGSSRWAQSTPSAQYRTPLAVL